MAGKKAFNLAKWYVWIWLSVIRGDITDGRKKGGFSGEVVGNLKFVHENGRFPGEVVGVDRNGRKEGV